jgi:hypothetical protein
MCTQYTKCIQAVLAADAHVTEEHVLPQEPIVKGKKSLKFRVGKRMPKFKAILDIRRKSASRWRHLVHKV